MNSQGLNSSYNEEFGLPATQMVDDGEDESQQSVHNDPKVWGRMVALMRGLDFVCFSKNEYASLFFLLLFFSFQQTKILTGTSSDEVEVVMFDSRILESPVHIVVFIVSSEATRRISTSSSWTAARTART